MLLISIFVPLITSTDCKDYKLPSSSRSFINSLRSLKSKRTMLLFGVDSYADFPVVSNFDELKDRVLAFLMGQFYSNFLIIILGLVAFFFFLSCTILITTFCIPRERSKPGWFTTIIWWIIFTILFAVSIIYFILSIAYAPKFIDNFPKIPEITQNSFTKIVNDTNKFISLYERKVMSLLNDVQAVYPSLALLMSDQTTTVVQTFIQNLNSLSNSINYFSEENIRDVNIDYLYIQKFIETFLEELADLNKKIIDLTNPENTNIREIYQQNSKSIPILYSFSNLKWTNAQLDILKFQYNEVERSKQSFDTDRTYVKVPLRVINIIVLILVCVFYAFQTATFFLQSSFSRCCVISIYPIAMVTSVGIAIFGIFATSVACSIGDVCADSTRFVSQYFFLRNETRDKYPFPIYNAGLFESPDNNFFTSIGGQYLINYENLQEIENYIYKLKGDVVLPDEKIELTVPTKLKDSAEGGDFTYSTLYSELWKLYQCWAVSYSNSAVNNDGKLDAKFQNIQSVIDVISDVNYRYSLQFHAIKTISTLYFFEIHNNSYYFENYFNESKNNYIHALQEFALSKQLDTSSFCCPVRDAKKVFCQDTVETFSCFMVFAHLYLLSLIGFGIVLCFRRQGMLSTSPIDDDKTDEKKKKDHSSDYEPRTADLIRTNQGTPREQKGWTMSDNSDSESKSSFTTLDMYAQSKIL